MFLGEFGGNSMGQGAEGVWQRTLVTFLKTKNTSYTYWPWNPDSEDTGGILQADSKMVNQSKKRDAPEAEIEEVLCVERETGLPAHLP